MSQDIRSLLFTCKLWVSYVLSPRLTVRPVSIAKLSNMAVASSST